VYRPFKKEDKPDPKRVLLNLLQVLREQLRQLLRTNKHSHTHTLSNNLELRRSCTPL